MNKQETRPGGEGRDAGSKGANLREKAGGSSMIVFGITATVISGGLLVLTAVQILDHLAFSNPLERAIKWGNLRAVEKILAEGHSPNEKFSSGLTPLTCTILECLHTPSWVLEQKYKETYAEKIDAEAGKMMGIIDVLVDKGANVNELDDRGQAILHYAIARFIYVDKRAEVAERLVERGADVNLRNWKSETPLHIAIVQGWGDLKTISVLVENGADINAKTRGRTPLSIALRDEREDVAEFLRQRGARE